MNTYIPEGYQSLLGVYDTQKAIGLLKRLFEDQLAANLNLFRVSAPLFLEESSGLNDNLNGYERPVSFDILQTGREAQVVQSLAKWKRMALYRYDFYPGKGLYTDMNAIRRDEDVLDNLHSVYVDQWDWEKVITRAERNEAYLERTAARIHAAVLEAETVLHSRFPALHPRLPANLTFVTSEELFDMYPGLAPEEREQAFVKKHRAVFVKHIGWPLGDGRPHGVRAPDYDDWSLNGDLLYYHPELDCCLEVSSMGIRVDASSMFRQLNAADARARLDLPFHRAVMEEKLPLTIGGGIGQSRLCMLLLGKAHIGEVQASVWDEQTIQACRDAGVILL